MGLPAAAGIDVYLGSGISSYYAGYVAPVEYGYQNKWIEGIITKGNKAENVTINLARNEHLSSLEVGIEPDAYIEQADPYVLEKPIIYYGSSITEGGCASRPGSAYTSIVSRWLDADYFNYGFSGSAKGECEFAEYIAAHKDISLFVYDYDHNALVEQLEITHEPFLRIIRKAHPTVPVFLLSRPDFDRDADESIKRRATIYQTFQRYINEGDRNIYFIDGQQFFGFTGRGECTIDCVHPTDLGFMRMAETIYPLAKQVLAL